MLILLKKNKQISIQILEAKVINKLLEKKTNTNQILQTQYSSAVITREFTGSGFFSNFKIPNSLPHVIPPATFNLGNLFCDINEIKQFGGFVLYIENGMIHCLEGYSFEYEWPKIITRYHLYYE